MDGPGPPGGCCGGLVGYSHAIEADGSYLQNSNRHGQRFGVDAAFPSLTQFSFWVGAEAFGTGALPIAFKTAVYRWSEAQARPVGPALWESAPRTISTARDWAAPNAREDFATGGLVLVPGEAYIALVTPNGIIRPNPLPSVAPGLTTWVASVYAQVVLFKTQTSTLPPRAHYSRTD